MERLDYPAWFLSEQADFKNKSTNFKLCSTAFGYTVVVRVKTHGLTLAEIILTLGILATVFLTVAGVFTSLMSSSGKNANQGVARRLAQRLLSRAVRESLDTGYSGSTRLAAIKTGAETEFFYKVEVDAAQGAVDSVGEIRHIAVEVTWWENGEESRQGMGQKFVKAEQLLYVGK